MVTMLPALTDGVTERLTPVSLYWMLVVMLPPVVTVSPTRTGCWLPTAMLAVWLSSTMREGLEMTLTSDLSANALSTARTSPRELRSVYEKPPKAGVPPNAMPPTTLATLLSRPVPVRPALPRALSLNTHCKPYCSSSVNVTSMMLASIRTWVGGTSSRLSVISIFSYSLLLP